MRAIVVTSGRPHIRPHMIATAAAVEVSELHGGLLYEAGQEQAPLSSCWCGIPSQWRLQSA